MLNKLFYVYGVDTSSLYTNTEVMIETKLNTVRRLKSLVDEVEPTERQIINSRIKTLKNNLIDEMKENSGLIRDIRPSVLFKSDGSVKTTKKVSMFDSCMARAFGLKENEFNDSVVIIRIYYFQIAESIIKNGFYINGEKYVFFSASAGQIRTKKLVAVKESVLNAHWNELTAGLTIDDINAQGGMNINKFIIYTSLCSSATELWENFDIDRCICVDDFEKTITGKVDYIDKNTFEVERIVADVPFNINDGCGMILPSLASTNFMIRMPFVKGLLGVFDFQRFIREHNCYNKIRDIYGDEHDIIEENIQIILTKSQFKMHKFWSSWRQYQDDFKKYHCTAGICNGMYTEDCDPIENSTINYQMIQTLYDLSPAELVQLAYNNIEDIRSIANTVEGKLRVFGATSWNKRKTGFQKCLAEYPPLLADRYTRKTLREIKSKLEKDLWSAKFKINAKYTFVLPDLYAYCEYLFKGDNDPVGLLRNGEVCCRLYGHREKLDCLRSPHLYIEHPIRLNNTINEWLTTDAIYISCHDMISRIVQCDYDGDKLLVTNEPIIINAAERINKRHKVVPLYYELGKAGAEIINDDSKFRGITFAFTHGNIGLPSNNITKIWNNGEITDEEIKAVKLLVAEVNWTIDCAKTLFKPEPPTTIANWINNYTKAKVPHFFIYAKDKEDDNVEHINNSVVNQIRKIYDPLKIKYSFNGMGRFDYKVLMALPNRNKNEQAIQRYRDTVKSLEFSRDSNAQTKIVNYDAVYEDARRYIIDNDDKDDVIDSIIVEIFRDSKTYLKKAFWQMFGNDIYLNIMRNTTTV